MPTEVTFTTGCFERVSLTPISLSLSLSRSLSFQQHAVSSLSLSLSLSLRHTISSLSLSLATISFLLPTHPISESDEIKLCADGLLRAARRQAGNFRPLPCVGIITPRRRCVSDSGKYRKYTDTSGDSLESFTERSWWLRWHTRVTFIHPHSLVLGVLPCASAVGRAMLPTGSQGKEERKGKLTIDPSV